MLALRSAARMAARAAIKRTQVTAVAAVAARPAQAAFTVLASSSKRAPALRSPLSRGFAVEATKVPSLGDSISEGSIVKWEVNVGDYVEADGVLVVIETDKVSVDIRSAKAGVLKSQKVKAGDTVTVGQEIAEVDTDAAKPSGGAACCQEGGGSQEGGGQACCSRCFFCARPCGRCAQGCRPRCAGCFEARTRRGPQADRARPCSWLPL